MKHTGASFSAHGPTHSPVALSGAQGDPGAIGCDALQPLSIPRRFTSSIHFSGSCGKFSFS
eukprot:3863631-Prymnesium_polylepis.1